MFKAFLCFFKIFFRRFFTRSAKLGIPYPLSEGGWNYQSILNAGGVKKLYLIKDRKWVIEGKAIRNMCFSISSLLLLELQNRCIRAPKNMKYFRQLVPGKMPVSRIHLEEIDENTWKLYEVKPSGRFLLKCLKCLKGLKGIEEFVKDETL